MQKSVLKEGPRAGHRRRRGVGIEGESIIVVARPRRAAPRCLVRGRRCDGYDALPARRWRAPDAGSARCCYVERATRRVERPEHGVKAGAVPWARTPSSRFTSAFGDQVAWLAPHMRRMPEFVELSRKVGRKRDGILRSIALGVSNARVEAVNNKIKVAIRQGYGFRNTDDLIALIMLRCSDLRPALPGRATA